ncbi:Tat pathway signal protein [Streptomyces sp. SID4919]|uniref:Tat pathway signal protein n=1 Tax=unclassified Streptomyces TaxID=2593676 RepID=UPI000C07576C|nr:MULTISPECIES: Tat pathway signal protein [unclassified Streptomyces]MYY10044.1 Tat pathway signal protein [Streptomyces sp. SID4919]
MALLLSLLVPVIAPVSSATAAQDTARGVAADACQPLALAAFGGPGDAVGRAQLAPDGTACFTVTTTEAGRYWPQADGGSDLLVQVRSTDGQLVDCYDDVYRENRHCLLTARATYTVTVVNQHWEPTSTALTVTPMFGTEGCAEPVSTRWDQPTVTRTATTPRSVACLPFEAAPGDRIKVFGRTVDHHGVSSWITDGSGAPICPRFPEDDEDSCVLPGDGPYRVLSTGFGVPDGSPSVDYLVKPYKLNAPRGCPTVPVSPFGPLATGGWSTVPCALVTTSRGGPHLVASVLGDRVSGSVRVYTGEGRTLCRHSAVCVLPSAGTYTVAVDGSTAVDPEPHRLTVRDRAQREGCRAFGTGLYRGELTTPGQYDCLALDSAALPERARIAALTPRDRSGVDPVVELVDGTGAVRCDADRLSDGDCALTGTAPFRLLVRAGDGESGTGPYRVAVYRTDRPTGCAALPAGSFAADGPKAALTTGGGVFAHCLTIPAGTRGASELIQLQATRGDARAEFSVLDGTGRKVCDIYATTSAWTLCALVPGQAHTVLFAGRDVSAAYTLARRDVTAASPAAGCTRTAATKVGGPAVKGTTPTPGGTLRCHRITTTAPSDVLHLDVRDAKGTVIRTVLNGRGEAECLYRSMSCAVTGGTSYLVLVHVVAGPAAPGYRLDAMRMATAAGPVAECVRVPSVAYGYGPVTGRLSESDTADCAVLPTAGYDRFDFAINQVADPARPGSTLSATRPTLYSGEWTDDCVSFSDRYQCAAGTHSSGPAPSVLLFGLPDQVSSASYRATLTCSHGLCGNDKVSATSFTPAAAPGGSKVTLTLKGTALHTDHTVQLTRRGRTLTAKPVSVSADRRTMKATVDLTGIGVGHWSVSYVGRGPQSRLHDLEVTRPELRATTAPKMSGTVAAGSKVTVSKGTWPGNPTSYAYQWKADGRAIAGATSSSYTVKGTYAGRKLTATVTARRSGWKDGTAATAAVTVAKGKAPKATKAPAITGTAKAGRTLKAAPGTWSPTATSYAYQWYANGARISGATKSSLVLKPAQRGKRITVKVTAHRTGHHSGAATSRATGPVAR